MSVPTPSRRSLLAASAWSVPAVVVASAAPAFAATPPVDPSCDEASYRFSWANFSSAAGTLAATPLSTVGVAGEPLILQVSNRLVGNMRGASAREAGLTYSNMERSPNIVGGVSRGLTLLQRISDGVPAGVRRNNRQEVTFSFSRPVKGLSFTVTDIDSLMPGRGSNQYRDQVEVTGVRTAVFGSNDLRGSGTGSAPWYKAGTQGYLTGSSNGNVRIQFGHSTPVQQFVLTFWNSAENGVDWWGRLRPLAVNGQQGIFVTDLSVTAASC